MYAVGPGFAKIEQSAGHIDVPLFLAAGEWDSLPSFREEAAHFGHVTDYRVLVLPRASHCHNFAPTRRLLWAALSTWINDTVHLYLSVHDLL